MPWLGPNYYDVRPTAERRKWSAFDDDGVTPLARGTSGSEAAAREAALDALAASRIDEGRRGTAAGRPSPRAREPKP